ncbi:MAG TPA: hypothetical protein VM942_05775, partial [Acidimicrobiales bacterium]|nr:hypothetical protein [Acidimicrobiales bacterium]
MPTVNELERLQALLGRLGPLSTKQRGELIEAGDWNDLVGVLTEVTRALLGEDRTGVVPDHEHTDQVKAGWLDPRLRRQVLGGPLADPAAEARLSALDRRFTRLALKVDDVGGGVDKVRAQVGEVTTRDLAREADVTRVGRKIDGLGDAREDVAGLRETLRALEVDVSRAVEVGRQLEVNGRPVDVSALVQRVEAVEKIRDSLTNPDGSLLDAASVERRLAELRTSLVTEEELTAALKNVRGGLNEADRASVLDASRVAAAEVATGSVRAASGELRAEIAKQLADVDDRVASQVGTATGELADTVLARARDETAAAVAKGDQALRSDLAATLDARLARIDATLESRIDKLAAEVGDRVAVAVSAQVPAALEAMEKRLSGIEGRLIVTERASADLDGRATLIATRVEEVRREGAAERAKLGNELGRRIDTMERGQDKRIATVVAAERAGLRTDLQADLEVTRRDLEQVLTDAAAKAANAEIRILATQLRGEVKEVVGDELALARTEFTAAVDARFSANENRVGGLVADEVRRTTAGLQRLVKEEVDALRP